MRQGQTGSQITEIPQLLFLCYQFSGERLMDFASPVASELSTLGHVRSKETICCAPLWTE